MIDRPASDDDTFFDGDPNTPGSKPVPDDGDEARSSSEDDVLFDGDYHTPEPLPAAETEDEAGTSRRLIWATAAVAALLFVLFAATGRMETLARNILDSLSRSPVASDVDDLAGQVDEVAEDDGIFTFKELDLHPDNIHQPYAAGPVVGDSTSQQMRLINGFRDLLALYEQRMGEDDNFTMRVVDNRNGKLLELYTLEAEREAYRQTEEANWDHIDQKRRQETRRLVQKYVAQGIPKAAITVKWGRADQVRQARKREAHIIEYEVRLARYLGMSLLPTEIGTVETFNQDHLISSVGARSRYQMMPYVLRQRGVSQYNLRTASGNTIPVYEEWNPLLSMEAAFLELRGYTYAVGHEIPGISSYHTGPGNLFMVYRRFMDESGLFNPNSTVLDAYVWAVTEGFDTVTRGTSFGQHSRGYVASGYGALRAMDDVPIDTSQTMRAERVQLKAGEQLYLSDLLRALAPHRDRLLLRDNQRGLYAHFRQMNPHMQLPAATDSANVPVRGDVQLVARANGADVRIFLPLGATRVLQDSGLDVIDEEKTFVYDQNTYANPGHEKTTWDRQYETLVQDIARFGFNTENRQRLYTLYDKFQELYRQNPTHYRWVQFETIKTHKMMWGSAPWNSLASTTAAAKRQFAASTPSPASASPAR